MAKSLKQHKAAIKPEVRKAARGKAVSVLVEMSLADVRRERGQNQTEVARHLDVAQPNVSKLEHQPDTLVSTLANYIEALGGELEIVAKFPDGQAIEITQFKLI